MKKIILIIVSLFFVLAVFSCGNLSTSVTITETTTDAIVSNTNTTAIRYSVLYNSNGGSDIAGITVDEGAVIDAPASIEKANYVFDGWYLDSQLSMAVNWPITIQNNTQLYAKWMDNKEYFLRARDRSVNADYFQYDFNLNVTTAYGEIGGPGANIAGNIKYNSQDQNPYYKYEERSGLLIGDGKTYSVLTGTQLAIFKTDTSDKLTEFSVESVSTDFRYESSSFAKALFDFTSEQIDTVILRPDGKYNISFSGSASGMISSVLSALNSSIVQAFIDLPENDTNLTVNVTFEDGYIKTFEYDFSISFSGASLLFHYDLSYANFADDVIIVPPSFQGIAITETAISDILTELYVTFDQYKSQQNSGFDYDIETHIDYPGSNSIDSHIQGRTMRLIDGTDVYFWNRIEFDSDYKNSDLYSTIGIIDYERYRVSYSNQDVYDIIDGFFSNTYTQISEYNNGTIDSFYFMIPSTLLTSENVTFIEKLSSNETTTYTLGLTNLAIINLLGFFDDSIRVDVNGENEIIIFNIESQFEVKLVSFIIEVDASGLVSIDIDIKGSYIGSYLNTEFDGALNFELNYSIITNNEAEDYFAPSTNNEVILSNE